MKDNSCVNRSIAKGFTWESFSFILTLIITYIYTGSVKTSIELTSICFTLKVGFFFLHERIWHQFTWGKKNVGRE